MLHSIFGFGLRLPLVLTLLSRARAVPFHDGNALGLGYERADSVSASSGRLVRLPGRRRGPRPAAGALHGGIGTDGAAPVYRVQSDFDYQSLALALYQEWIELDLFHWGLAAYSVDEFEFDGLNAEHRFLLQHMAEQEVGCATVLTNMLGPQAPRQCSYSCPVSNEREFLDINLQLTRWGEAGVYGFLLHLDSPPATQLLLQSITIEARQQMILCQLNVAGWYGRSGIKLRDARGQRFGVT
ncbi:hypothetical protein CDD83_7534 [Cordyceps sp. RAO-2017]|nr:hypothetical protein CDD83_7534 [Cordyceps sp. RAO-2017]